MEKDFNSRYVIIHTFTKRKMNLVKNVQAEIQTRIIDIVYWHSTK